MTEIWLATRVALLVVFAAALGSKLRPSRFTEFADALSHVEFLPGALSRPLAGLIVGLELASLVLLLSPVSSVVVLGVIVVTFVLLTFGVAFVVGRHAEVQCRCFGSDGETIHWRHVARNVLLLLLSAAMLAWALAASGRDAIPSSVGATVLALMTGLLVGMCITRWDDLAFVVIGPIPDGR